MKLEHKVVRPQVYRKSSHSIVNAQIDHDALKIIARLKRSGFAAYIVGGGVRDLLLRKRPKDFDIATSATPRQVKSLFRNCRIIGRRFKLAHIFFRGNKIIEVSTFRDSSTFEDDSSEQNNSQVTLASDNVYGNEHTDAIRRDLTINALFYDPLNYSIIDYVGGIKDLKDEIIRIIGDPDQRFIEDPVRMIRAIRHAGRTGFKVSDDCAKSIKKNHALLEKCPAMRIFEELKKDFVSGYCFSILQHMHEHNLIEHILPQFSSNNAQKIWSKNSYFSQCFQSIDTAKQNGVELSLTAILALLCIFSWNLDAHPEDVISEDIINPELPSMISKVFKRLAVPRKEKEKLAIVIRNVFYRLTNPNSAKNKRKSDLNFDCDCLLAYLGFNKAPETHSTPEQKQRKRGYFNRARR